MNIASEAVGLIVDPVSLVYVSVYMDELSMAVSAVVSPLPFIACAVGPHLDAKAVAEAPEPLA